MLALFVSALLLVMTSLSPAIAHSKLTQTVPRDGGSVKAGLQKIELKFGQPLWIIYVYLARQPNGPRLQLVEKGEPAYRRVHTISVDPLKAGSYAVDWAAVASDKHVMVGHFEFAVRD